MAVDDRAVRKLTTATLLAGAIAVLGWVALLVGAVLGKLPANLFGLLWFLEDAAFFALLGFGPALVAAGLGLRKRRRWGRTLTLAVASLAGLLAVAGAALAAAGVLRVTREQDFLLPVCFAAYCVAAFVVLWNEPFAAGPDV